MRTKRKRDKLTRRGHLKQAAALFGAGILAALRGGRVRAQEGAVEVAEDLGDGTAQNFVVYPDGTKVPAGCRYSTDTGECVPARPLAATGTVELQTDHMSGPRGEILDRALTIFFDQFPNLRVLRLGTTGSGEAITAAFVAGTAGDLKLSSWSLQPDLIERQQLFDLTSFLRRDNLSLADLYGVAQRVHVQDGRMWGVPYQLVSYALLYNKTLFQRAGVRFPTSAWTWDDLLEAAKRLVIREGNEFKQIGFMALNSSHNQGWGGPVMAAGGKFVDDEGRKTLLDQPANLEPFTFYVELITKHQVAPFGPGSGVRDFNAGTSALDIDQIVEWGRSSRVRGLEFDIVPVPKWAKTNRRVTFADDQPHIVPRAANNPEGAWALAKFLSWDPNIQEILAGPQRRGFFPVLKSVVQTSPVFAEPPPANIQAAVVEGLESGMPSPTFVGADRWYRAVLAETAKAYRGELSPIEALRAATRAGDAAIAAARGTR